MILILQLLEQYAMETKGDQIYENITSIIAFQKTIISVKYHTIM